MKCCFLISKKKGQHVAQARRSEGESTYKDIRKNQDNYTGPIVSKQISEVENNFKRKN
jgi:hypothetical protein